MNEHDDTLDEQLSAYMDGELPEAQARFLQRRLEHDEALRAKWTRLQLASNCIKGQPALPMSPRVCRNIRAELEQSASVQPRRGLRHWAVAASVAALALVFAPRLLQHGSPDVTVGGTQVAAPAADHTLASLASADLVATPPATSSPVRTAPLRASGRSSARPEGALIESDSLASVKSSPIPLSAQSPSDFPLVDSGDKRRWPRSQLIGGNDDPALEAYLVRHNQMLANDGLGGFVPYVDVVASDQPATAGQGSQDAGADR